MLEKIYTLNLIIFLGGIILFSILEYFFAFRRYTDKKIQRWWENMFLTFLNTLIIRIFFIVTPLSVAFYVQEHSIGIFHILGIPGIIGGVIAFFLLEMIVYGEHVLFHKVPFLWKIHKVHHSDLDMDFSTALRFHLFESIFSVITKIIVILVLWAPVLSVILFEIILNFSAMFNHSNFNLPKKWDRLISKIIVTPKFHEIHHSQIMKDSQSNYGFFLSVWDYVFKTYETHDKKVARLGLSGQKERYNLKKLLLLKVED